MKDCEEWRMDSAVRNTRTTVFWKRGTGVVRVEIERFGEYPERSALVLHELAVTEDGTMLPFAVGNRWVYRIEMYGRPFTGVRHRWLSAASPARAGSRRCPHLPPPGVGCLVAAPGAI